MEKVKRSYDPDEFDWDIDQDQAVVEQVAVDDAQSLIRTALLAAEPVEDRWLRPSKVDADRARVQYNVPYSLSAEQKDQLSELVGETRTMTYNASGYHDHPLSHVCTEISEDMVVRKFGNEPFVSVWGNYSRHRRMGHTGAKVVTDRVVPHDWFRNRGVEEACTSVADFLSARGHMKYRLFLATHAMYYMSLDDVARWLGSNPDAEFHSIIHRHDKSSGWLNKGEIKYEVDSAGIVTQTNPLTGFTYSHKSMEPLFHVDSCRLFNGKVGLAWDISKLAGDNYHVKFTLCRPDVAENIQDPSDLIKHSREVVVRGDVTVYRALGYTWYVYHGAHGEVLLKDVELFDRLRRFIAGKERTPRARQDLMAMCRRLANKQDIVSIHQGYVHEVNPELMTDYVNAAFYADVQHELEVALRYHRENKAAVDALNKYLINGEVPTDFTPVAKVGRAIATPFTHLGGLLYDHSVGARVAAIEGRPIATGPSLPPDPRGERRTLVDQLNKDAIDMIASLSVKPKKKR